jgi:hypothetical protein
MEIPELDKLITSKHLRSYAFDVRDDTGQDPYSRVELVFSDGTKLIVLPEGKNWDGIERIGLYF